MNQTSINGKIKMFQPLDNRIDFRKSIESKAILLLKFEKDRQSKHSVNILQHLINLGRLNQFYYQYVLVYPLLHLLLLLVHQTVQLGQCFLLVFESVYYEKNEIKHNKSLLLARSKLNNIIQYYIKHNTSRTKI